ncbi:MAG: hypothetical protein KJO88_03235 [Gammaproteobacteria bacterium]|nr:hypothetical protein [Gammaproteobacteria bacterium]
MQDNEIKEEKTIGILRSGPREMENWASKYQNSDFYDFKADVEAILKLSSNLSDFSYVDSQQAYLHPGQSASLIRLDDSAEKALKSAYFGQLHPQFQKKISAVYPVYIAEIPFSLLEERQLPKFSPVSTYPQSRRDLSLLVPEGLSSSELLEVCKQTGPDFLQRSWVFDVYQGKGVESGQKSVGLGLIFQEKSRTLTDEEIDVATSGIVAGLRQNCSAELRDA